MSIQVQGQSNIVYNTTASAATSAPVSIYNVPQPQQTTSPQNKTEKEKLIQEFEKKLNNLLAEYEGITKDGLIQCAKEAGFQINDNYTLTEEKIETMLKYIREALDKSSEIDKNGKKVVNKDKLKQCYKENYEKILESVKKGLGAVLEKYLPKGKNILTATKEEFKAAVEAFLTESIKEIKNNKNLTPEQMKEQMGKHINQFKALLAATPDELKVRIWNAAEELLAENGQIKEAITEMIKSFVTPENLQQFLHKVSQEDLKKLGINVDDLTQAVERAAKSEDPQAIADLMDSLVNLVKDFYKNNNETIDRCRQKVADYKKQNNIADDKKLSDEQLQEILGEDYEVYKSLKNLEAMFSGGSVGAAEQNVDTQRWFKILQEQNINLNDIYSQMKAFIEAHKDELNLTPEQLRDILNKATGNAYGKVTGDVSPDINVAENNAAQTAKLDYGIVQRWGEDAYYAALSKVEELKQSFVQDKREEFVVEKPTTSASKACDKHTIYNTNSYSEYLKYLKSGISLEELAYNFGKIKNRAIQVDVAEKVSELRERTDLIKNNMLAIFVNKEKGFDDKEKKKLKDNGISGIILDSLNTNDVT